MTSDHTYLDKIVKNNIADYKVQPHTTWDTFINGNPEVFNSDFIADKQTFFSKYLSKFLFISSLLVVIFTLIYLIYPDKSEKSYISVKSKERINNINNSQRFITLHPENKITEKKEVKTKQTLINKSVIIKKEVVIRDTFYVNDTVILD